MTDAEWERGDMLGHDFPVHIEALRAAGPTFLTGAFRATGAMGESNRVTAITQLEPFIGGSTGRKAVLRVTYEHPDPNLPEDLFVKFSRDLDNEIRDRGKRQMESEVRFGLLSQIPDFPVAVPRCLFGDYHLESGSGVLISERIAFGANGIEPHHPKARDYEIEDLQAHYDALVSALARLAGSDRAGRFPEEVMAHFEPRPPEGDGPPSGVDHAGPDPRPGRPLRRVRGSVPAAVARIDPVRRVHRAAAGGSPARRRARRRAPRCCAGQRERAVRLLPLERQHRQRLVLARRAR